MQNLLVLDLDETLVYATEELLHYESDFMSYSYHVYKRPYLDEFLRNVFKYYKVAVWTASDEKYAQVIIDNILPEGLELEFLYTSEKCTLKFNFELQEYYKQKKLKKLKKKGFKLENILIVDDSPNKAEQNYGNYIRIKPFEGEQDDCELKHLESYLKQLKDCNNVRNLEKRFWRETQQKS